MSDSKRIVKNSIFLYGRKLISIIAAIYSVRFVLQNLGIEDFGIYSLLGGLIAMLSFFNNAMISSTQRHLSFSMGKGVINEVNDVFNASLRIHIFISCLIILIGETVGLIIVDRILEIPDNRMNAAMWVYQSVIFILVLDVLSVPYQAIANAKEDMHVIAIRDILHSLGKLLIAFSLGLVFFDRLKLYGVLLLLLNFGIVFSFYWFCKNNYQESRFYFKKYKKSLYNELTSFAGWTLFGALAAVSRNQGNAIILNLFFGPKMNASYGVATQLSYQALSVSNIFLQASNPQIVKSFGAGDKDNSYKLSNFISRFSFYVLFLFSLPVILNIDFILNLWLEEVPKYANIFCQLLLINFLVGIISNPLITLIQATGKIKKFQIVNGTLFLLNIPFAYWLLKVKFPPYSIFYSLIFVTFVGVVVKLYFINKLEKFPVKEWINEVLLRVILVVTVSTTILYFTMNLITFNSEILITITSFTASFFLVLVIIILLGMRKDERKFIFDFLIKRIYK